ncbi:cobalamin biosynthesis protein [Halonotius sp. GCM10025705]|uniref:cobalamin biosynthesis protein n=1 Tax=Halonotius sp. GCM10025705 TaxID=3252678 RepID=UPI0036223F9E
MSLMAAGVVLAAVGLDRVVGEPPARLHPVAWVGRLVGPLDRSWPAPRLVGAVGALCLPLLAAAVVALGVGLAGDIEPLAGGVVAALVLFSGISLRLLCTTAGDVLEQTETDIAGAREALLALAGRDATDLSAGHVRSAAVESAAENLSDGFVAPLAGFAVGSVVASRWLTPSRRWRWRRRQRRGSRPSTRWIRWSATARNRSAGRPRGSTTSSCGCLRG